jgi:uncharacterized protein
MRSKALAWLRRTHLYLGLWGAVMGLLFGATGIVLNHRAVLRIPVEKVTQSTAQLPIPAAGLANVDAMAAWLAAELGFRPEQVVLRKAQPAQAVAWGEREVMQPERWTVTLHSPSRGVSAEYYAGNRSVRLEQANATPIGWLTRMHMSVGASAAWVLLADSIAGSFILLSITGLLLWTKLNTLRTTACLVSVGALTTAALLTAF